MVAVFTERVVSAAGACAIRPQDFGISQARTWERCNYVAPADLAGATAVEGLSPNEFEWIGEEGLLRFL